ncbi:MAG TPA: hypothetical protein VF523_08455, partial [Burkholderiales bacterium]
DFFDVVVTSALAIENRMLRNLRGAMLLTFSTREDLLATPWEAIVAFDAAGVLVGGNATARRLLALQRMPHEVRFEELFDATFSEALRHLGQHDGRWSLQSASGLRVSARFDEQGAAGAPQPARKARPQKQAQDAAARCESTLRFLDVVSADERTRQAVAKRVAPTIAACRRCSWVKPAPARSWWPGHCTIWASGRNSRSLQ